MFVQAFQRILRTTALIKAPIHRLYPKKLNTQVFSKLAYHQIANPQLMKALIIKPIHNHSRMTQRYLYHKKRVSSKIKSCFSQKKHKVYRRVHKVRRRLYSDILQKKIPTIVSKKAERTIKKMGSFDNYILCTKPKDLDSKYGQYLRELMLRKINNPNFQIPYIIGTNRVMRKKKYHKYVYLRQVKKITIPPQLRKQFRTVQPKFGKTPQQLTNQDYAKYLQLENLKKTLGDQLEPTHPLIVELREKMDGSQMTKQQTQKFYQMAKQAELAYINDPKHGQANRKRVEKIKHDVEIMNIKTQQMKSKINQNRE